MPFWGTHWVTGVTTMCKYAPDNHLSPAKLPAFLYLKGRIFYYRYKLPKQHTPGCPAKEIRISLRTAYQFQASRIAAQLHALTKESLEHWTMSGHTDFAENMKRIKELRKFLQDELNKILDAPDKRELSPSDIRKRLNGYLKYQIDDEAVSPTPPDIIQTEDDEGNIENVDIAHINDNIASMHLNNLNTGNNFDNDVQRCVFDLVKNGVFDISEISRDNVDGLTRSYLAMQISLQKIRAARLRGDFSYEQPYHQAEYTPYQQSLSPAEEKYLNLDELIDRYCVIKVKDGAWAERSLADHKNRVTSLLRIIGNKPINSITRQDMRSFRDTLQKLPPRWREQLDKSGLSIKEFIEKYKNKTPLSIKSINVIVEAVSGMFTWAMRENLIERNPAQGLGLKDTQQDIEKRLPLTDDDIKRIFFCAGYKPSAFKNPAYYWVPLIALYTGMRLEEICQLHCEDIYEEDGIFLIDIREDSTDGLCDKILKTKNAKRKIPIHEQLIKLGLISYRNAMIKSNQIRLFPLLNKTEKSPKYGKQVGKAFGLLLKEKNIVDGKSFHSLRHSFSNFFKVRNMHTDMFRQVFGHEIQNLAGRQYGDKFSIKQIYEELISKISFEKSK